MENDRELLSESVRGAGRNDEWPFWPPYVRERGAIGAFGLTAASP